MPAELVGSVELCVPVEPAPVVVGGVGVDFSTFEVVGDGVCHDMEARVFAEEFVGEPVDFVGGEGDGVDGVDILVVVAGGQVVLIEFDGGDLADFLGVFPAVAGDFKVQDDSSHVFLPFGVLHKVPCDGVSHFSSHVFQLYGVVRRSRCRS